MKYFMIAAWKLVLMNREEKLQWLGKNIEKKPTTTETKTKVYRHKSLEGKTDRWRSDGQTDGHWGALQTQQKKVAMSCNCFEKNEKTLKDCSSHHFYYNNINNLIWIEAKQLLAMLSFVTLWSSFTAVNVKSICCG